MPATLIDGKAIADDIRAQLKVQISARKALQPDLFKPKLVVVQVGARDDSSAYVRTKGKACKEIGIEFEHIKFDESVKQPELISHIKKLVADTNVHGILVQMPLPAHISEAAVVDAVGPEKDVDGFHADNIGNLTKRHAKALFEPCTPRGCIELLQRSGVQIAGKRAVVIGRSDIVGTPVAAMLTNGNATVTLCHSRTQNLEQLVGQADIVVVAIGQAELVKGEWLKPGAVVIDVGMNSIEDKTKKSGWRFVGDVHFESAKEVASLITPVPGGVGPMTVAMLMQNTFLAASRAADAAAAPVHLSVNPLQMQVPVPSDIDIAMAQTPKPIQLLADELQLAPGELELHGSYKAKVGLEVLERLKHRANGRYILVAGTTPTPLGEGKSTTTIGLCQALGAHLNRPAFACVRQPSQGPTFGIKGGAAGGGYS
ncbi:hypothetical protein GQ42DRAFT_127118, partial [Ramicandelaber brevisporus]